MKKVQQAQNGLVDHIERINNRLGYPELPMFERQGLQEELSKTSKLLDYTEQFVPRPRPSNLVQPSAMKGPNL